MFDTVANYKAFATAFPVGKVIQLLDRGDYFIIISGVGTADDYGTIANTTTSQSATINDVSKATAKSYGATNAGIHLVRYRRL